MRALSGKLLSATALSLALVSGRRLLAEPKPDASRALGEVAAFPTMGPGGSYQLANGLIVRYQQDRSRSQVAIAMTFDVGYRDDPTGRAGMAHLIEHLLVGGSANAPRHKFHRELDASGAVDFNATTSAERTSMFATFPASTYASGLWLFSDALAFLLTQIDQRSLEIERGVVINERWLRKNSTGQVAGINLFPEGHRRRPRGDADLENIQLGELQGFFQRWYGPNNAVLAIVGNFDPSEARALVERYFGPIRNSFPKPARKRIREPAPRFGQTLDVRVGGPYDGVIVAWPAPGLRSSGFPAFALLAEHLDGTPFSVKHRLLEENLAEQVAWSFEGTDFDGLLVLDVRLAAGADAAAVIDAVERELEVLRRRLLPQSWLDDQRRRKWTKTGAALARLNNRAIHLSRQDWPLEKDPERYRALTPEAIRHTAARYFNSSNRLAIRFRGGQKRADWW
jgi:zinc protease